jgi:teichuronic acid biosynthesis glycosyltransferase TuaG
MSKGLLPLVSIITPAFNSETYIAKTIHSVQKQTFTNWELIIIDDASEDNTVSVIKFLALNDPRIICLQNQQNSGAATTRNKGLEHARGRFIAFLDSDDL